MSLYEKLNQSMRWITVESCLYEGLIILHYYLLFNAIPLPLYGKIGTAMSMIYLVVYRVCGGLEEVLGSFYTQWSTSRQGFRHYLFWQYTILYVILLFSMLLFWWGSSGYSSVSSVIALTTFLECTKKSMRSLLKIIFYNRIVAITEIITMVSYFIIIWIPYWLGYPISLLLVIWPLGAISIIGNIVYAITCFVWYRSLPPLHDTPITLGLPRIMQSIFFSYFNQLATVFFSSSFLVPLIAWCDTLSTAGIVKLISTTINSLTKIIDKVFGASSCAVLAHAKDDHTHRQYYFGLISNRLLQVVIAIILFTSINMPLLAARLEYSSMILQLIILYFLITLTDRMTTMYERFFIIHEHGIALALVNGFAGLMLLVIFYVVTVTPLHLLVCAFFVRLLSLATLALLAYYKWSIHPSFSIAPSYIVSILSASIAFLFLVGP